MSKNDIEGTLCDYEKKGFSLGIPVELKSGKEATVYSVCVNDEIYLLKVYKDLNKRSFQDNQDYVAGRYYRKPSLRKAVSKRNMFAKKYLHKAWVRREFYLLKELNELGADVPRPVEYTYNSVLMQFYGKDGYLAPRLIDVELTKKQASSVFQRLLENIKLFSKAGIVHGDLSPYNILFWENEPIIIDFPQAVDLRNNPNREELLRRDLNNLINYFQKFLKIDRDEIYGEFLNAN